MVEPVGGTIALAVAGAAAGTFIGTEAGIGFSRWLRGADSLPLMSGAENITCGNRKEAFNTAKARGGIPRSQQPVTQWKVGDDPNRASFKNYRYSPLDTSAHGFYFLYDTPQGPRVIVEHLNDGAPHFHAGEPKDPFTFTDFKNERYKQVGGSHHIWYGE